MTAVARSEVRSGAKHGLERVGSVRGDDGTDLAVEVDDKRQTIDSDGGMGHPHPPKLTVAPQPGHALTCR
jgi:hypothetical protein